MPYVLKKKRRRIHKGDIKLYLKIAVLCSILGFGIAFLTSKLSSLSDRSVQNSLILKAKKYMGKALTSNDMEKIKDKFRNRSGSTDKKSMDNPFKEEGSPLFKKETSELQGEEEVDSVTLEKYKEILDGKMDPATREKMKKIYREETRIPE